MAEKEKGKKDDVEEIPWTPDKPLPDDDDEEETQRRARAEARKAHLIGEYAKPTDKKKKSAGSERRSLFG